jgi:hypothetical protein
MASGFNISTFKSRGLTLGGARPSLFEVYLSIPTFVAADTGSDTKFRFTCRAAQLPAATVSAIDVNYFGRPIKFAGDRTFADWTVTVMNDEDFLVRSMFEKWSNALNKLQANVRQAYGSENDYKATLNVLQYSKSGNLIRGYDIIGAFPTTVDSIDLNWDSTNQIETFGVTFSYDYWLPTDGTELRNAYLGAATSPVSN